MAPQLARLADAVATFRQQQAALVDPELVDLCWQRIQSIIDGSETTPIADGPRERACLELAEYFCYSPQSVTDEHVANVLQHLPAQDTLALTTSMWVADASSRLGNFVDSLGIAANDV